MFALYGVGIRLTHAYNSSLRWWLLSIVCLAAYLANIIYLSSTPRFDYSWNVLFNAVLGAMHNLFWLAFSIKYIHFLRLPARPTAFMPSYSWKPGALAILTTLATLLELFDFPPLRRVVDAHALWHLATAPITLLWYWFLAEDGVDSGWKKDKD